MRDRLRLAGGARREQHVHEIVRVGGDRRRRAVETAPGAGSVLAVDQEDLNLASEFCCQDLGFGDEVAAAMRTGKDDGLRADEIRGVGNGSRIGGHRQGPCDHLTADDSEIGTHPFGPVGHADDHHVAPAQTVGGEFVLDVGGELHSSARVREWPRSSRTARAWGSVSRCPRNESRGVRRRRRDRPVLRWREWLHGNSQGLRSMETMKKKGAAGSARCCCDDSGGVTWLTSRE